MCGLPDVVYGNGSTVCGLRFTAIWNPNHPNNLHISRMKATYTNVSILGTDVAFSEEWANAFRQTVESTVSLTMAPNEGKQHHIGKGSVMLDRRAAEVKDGISMNQKKSSLHP